MQSPIFRFVLVAMAAIVSVACAPTSAVVIGNARPSIKPEEVKLYLRPPRKFQEIALLETSSRASWAITDQGKMDVVMQRLREEAARLGANGILLQGAGSQYGGSVSTAVASGGSGYGMASGVAVPIFVKAGSGIAIFVEEE